MGNLLEAIFGGRCYFCGKGNSLGKTPNSLEKTPWWGQYGFQGNTYHHDECLDKVLANPRAYTSRSVDMAIEIADSMREKKQQEQSNREYREKQCQRALCLSKDNL